MATYNFADASGDHKWSTLANWSGSPANPPLQTGVMPSTDTITFTTGKTCIQDVNITIAAGGSVQFTNTAFTQNAGTTITMTGGTWNNGSTSGGSYTYGGTVTQSGGTFNFSNVSTSVDVNGVASVSAGSMFVVPASNSDTTASIGNSASIAISGNATFGIVASFSGHVSSCTIYGAISYATSSACTLNNGAGASSVSLSSTGSITVSSGTVTTSTYTNAVTLSGAVTIGTGGTLSSAFGANAGTLTISSSAVIGVASGGRLILNEASINPTLVMSGGSITVAAGGEYDFKWSGTTTFSGTTVTINGANLTLANAVTNASLAAAVVAAMPQTVADSLKLAPSAGSPATGSVMDKLATAGLTQQQVTDALKLAPTAGASADGSVMDRLDAKVSSRAATGAAMTLTEIYDAAKTAGTSTLTAAQILKTPANLLDTDADGKVTTSNPATSGVTEVSATAGAQASIGVR